MLIRTTGQGTKDDGLNPTILLAHGNELDDPKWKKRLDALMTFRRQARIAQVDNRREMAVDEDFYDNIQLDPEDLSVLLKRKQPILTFNVIKDVINWILGTEKKARIDYDIRPRRKQDVSEAKAKTKLFKYDSDINHAGFARSAAFADCIKAGVGWLEIGARNHPDSPIYIRPEKWRNVWFDHLSTDLMRRDARFVIREKWIDLDVAMELFPDREDKLKMIAENVNSLYPYLPDEFIISDAAAEFDTEIDGMFGSRNDSFRERVRITECQYRIPGKVPILRMVDEKTPFGCLDGTIYRKGTPDHDYLVRGGYFETQECLTMVVRFAQHIGSLYLKDCLSPYNHFEFSLVPMWCYVRQRDNMPYGVIRDIRDPQIDLNKRRSRSLFLLSANQIKAEKGAVDDKQEAIDEANRPDGYVEYNKGTMLEIVRNLDLGTAHLQMAQDDERFIGRIAGYTDPELAQSKKELSGKAIGLLQGNTQIAGGVYWDNYYYNFQLAGDILLSVQEQFYDQPMEIQISGDTSKEEFVGINQRQEDGSILNPITRSKGRFIVGKQDYRESIRMAMTETLLGFITSISKTSPQVALAMLDLAVELMDDLPNKAEMVSRIRKINKQHAPEDEMKPEEKQAFEDAVKADQQKQQMIEQLQFAMGQAKLKAEQGKADSATMKALKDKVDAYVKELEGFLKALEVATAIQINPQIVGAADTIIAESKVIAGGNGDANKAQPQGQQGPPAGQRQLTQGGPAQ